MRMDKQEYLAVIEQNNTRAKKRLSSSVSDMKEHQPESCTAHIHVVHNAEAQLGAFETLLDNQFLQAQFQVNGSSKWTIGAGIFKVSGRGIVDFVLFSSMILLFVFHFQKLTDKTGKIHHEIQTVAEVIEDE